MIYRLDEIPQDAREIVLFGCTEYSKEILCELEAKYPKVDVVYFDNYYSGETFNEIKVQKPQKKENTYYILASLDYSEQMEKQLIEMGVKENFIVLPDKVCVRRMNKAEQYVRKRIPYKTLRYLCIDLAEHCNLNCQCCDHFSPLAEENITDIKEFESDLSRVAELFGGDGSKIDKLCLEGGEPFLNKDIIKYVKIVRKLFPKSVIDIYTNGTLMLKQSDDVWEILREKKIGLEITKYPIEFPYEKILEKAENYEVKCEFFSGGKTVKESMHKPLDLSGKNDKYDSFHKCYMGNGMCTMLKHGKIYPCTVMPNIEHFNSFFSQNIEVSDKDSINIYGVKSAEEILEFLANPIPGCRYCQPDRWTSGHMWKTTTYLMSEWAD